MEGDEPTQEPTQATQTVLDPRRVGKQNSGFSDEDISDIICILYPHSDSARQEVRALAADNSPHIIGSAAADGADLDYENEDHASRFESNPANHGSYAILLRLSAQVKNPASGFAFGRNNSRCDVVFVNDPMRRVSNIHFRIYVNEYGNVMIEDQSTNGTFVDSNLLTSNPKDPSKTPVRMWVLSSGSEIKILLHNQVCDLAFRVRIPRRDDEYDRIYGKKVDDYFTRHGLPRTLPAAGPPGGNGHVDLFKPPAVPNARRAAVGTGQTAPQTPSKRRETHNVLRPEWTGSGKYNRIGMVGKGAFAIVYKVTSKYDGRPYAAKEIEKRRFIKNGVLDQKVENEMKIMQRVNHPHIVRYMENIEWDDRLLIIIMEFVPGGDLGKLISENGPLPEEVCQVMAKQLLGALGYLHANNITHRDVKPDNILINSLEPLDVKLTDFGLSKMVDSDKTFLETFCGTLLYCAPEVYTEYAEYDENGVRNRANKKRRVPGQRYDHAVDIWSLGGVLFYSLTGSAPYPVKNGISYSELLHKIMTTMLNISPLQAFGVSETGIEFLLQMLQRRPEIRARVEDLDIHPWLVGPDATIEASQSYDRITDEEDNADSSQARQPFYDEYDRVSESMDEDEDSEKENGPLPRAGQAPGLLFGEVNSSAVGSSGVMPDHLNLPPAQYDPNVTEIMDSHIEDDTFDSAGPRTIRHGPRRVYRETTASISQNQSTDQLQSLVADVASQSLGGSETMDKPGTSMYLTNSMDPNSSKRKPPPSLETSEEMDENTPPGKPIIKRLKSENNMESMSDESVTELRLLARMPQIKRLGSGRQVDGPVDKQTFWEQDKTTWHLHYPEMTQLQHDAFNQAARDRGEEFAPGKTPYWDLAMKYFPPSTGAQHDHNGSKGNARVAGVTQQQPDETSVFPSTAATDDPDAIPDTLKVSKHIVVPVQDDVTTQRAVAMMDSHPNSCIDRISLPVTDSLLSFGRGPENTRVFEPRTEPRVPKYAFKIMLWKEGYDPSKDPSKVPHPWVHNPSPPEADAYYFWISSKATSGIEINGQALPSSDPKNPGAPSEYWAKLHNGDSLLIWGSADTKNQTTLRFHCFWGGSSATRGSSQALELAAPSVAQKIDTACQKTERRIRDATEKRRKLSDAKAEHLERSQFADRERERSLAFEKKRKEAVDFLVAKQTQQSRRASPATAGAPASRLLTAQGSRLSPDKGFAYSTR